MIRFEDEELEGSVFREKNDIAVPIEITVPEDGERDLLVYSFVRETAETFEKRFGDEPFSREAKAFLREKLSPLMESLGYETAGAADHDYREYVCSAPETERILPDCVLIDSLRDETAEEELGLGEFILNPDDPLDRMAVIRRDGLIVAYAGVNDLSEEEGLPEIYVEVAAGWRRRGYGASCVAKLTQYLNGLGCPAVYTAPERNTASIRTAEAVGYVLRKRVSPFVCYRKEEED